MVKMTRNAIGCLLSTNSKGEVPPLGQEMLVTISYATPRKRRRMQPTTLELVSEYYDSIQELSDKGLVQFDTDVYRLTERGKKFLCELRSRWGAYAV